MARAYWKGYLRLSLVAIGIELYSATQSSSRLSLHQIHKPSGKRVRYQKTAPGIGPIDSDDIVKGYEIDKDEYVLIEPDELDDLKLESRSSIELVQFVEHHEIDPRYFAKPYYVVPADDEVAAEGFTVIREALRKAGKVGLGQMAVRGRDHIIAVKPCGDGLLLETLRYADEIRESDQIFAQIPELKADKDMLGLATELIDRKTAPFEPEAFQSQYFSALKDLIDEKREAGRVSSDDSRPAGSGGGQVVDLMAALKKSVEKSSKGKAKSRSRSAPAKKKAS
ncbi:non-homologous end joining protein Ku [Maricaulis sp. CAU 1757]